MSRKCRGGIAVLTIVLVASSALGVDWEKGLKFYVDHQFDAAIECCKGAKDIPSRLVMGLSYTERYNIYKDKNDKEQAKIYLNLLKVDINMEHMDVLDKFLAVPGNMNGDKEAGKLLVAAFKNARTTPEDVLKMAEFLDPAKGDSVNKTALSAIGKRLAPVRGYVSKGGTMPEKMQGLFTNPKLINPLVVSLGGDKTASGAKKCLVLIEEPTLKALEAQELTKAVSDTMVAVKKAIAARQKKYPDSTWSSAYGR